MLLMLMWREQVMKVQQTIVAKCPNLAVPYRRLVCYCRLYEVQDRNKKDRPGENSLLHYQLRIHIFRASWIRIRIH
jgi:hypothetical protein